MCFCCFAVSVDWFLMSGSFVIGYVRLVCVFCFAVVVDDWCLYLTLCHVVICYVKVVCAFVLPLLLRIWCDLV